MEQAESDLQLALEKKETSQIDVLEQQQLLDGQREKMQSLEEAIESGFAGGSERDSGGRTLLGAGDTLGLGDVAMAAGEGGSACGAPLPGWVR